MWAAIASFVVGVCGWGFAKLLFEPLKEIIDLRREAQECLIFYGNLSKDAPSDERRTAADSFRRVGVGLVSRHIAAYPWVAWASRQLRWDIHSAGALLISIGNSIQFEGFSFISVSPIVPQVRQCLRLPVPNRPPVIEALMQHAGQPNMDEPLP